MKPDPLTISRADGALRWLVGLACAVIIVGGVKAAAPLVTQLLVIAFLAIILTPCYHFLRRRRLPGWLASTLLIVALVGVFSYGMFIMFPQAVFDFAKKIPTYHKEVVASLESVADRLRANDVNVPEAFVSDLASLDAGRLKALAVGSVTRGSGLLGNAVIILVVVSFYIAGLPRFPATLSRQRWLTPDRRELIDSFVLDVRHYMGIKTVVSAATGLCIYAGLRLLGVDSPVLLALVAFFLNFVPGIGSLIAAVPGVLLALHSGNGTAVATAVLYLVVNQVFGNILEPRVMGAGFGVSPVTVLLSVVFWGWVLGPVGMLFAVPLTMAVRGAVSPSRRSAAAMERTSA